jgi:hypothetical protein
MKESVIDFVVNCGVDESVTALISDLVSGLISGLILFDDFPKETSNTECNEENKSVTITQILSRS